MDVQLGLNDVIECGASIEIFFTIFDFIWRQKAYTLPIFHCISPVFLFLPPPFIALELL